MRKRIILWIIGYLVAAATIPFAYWLSGFDFHRGDDLAVCFWVTLLTGFIGICLVEAARLAINGPGHG